jgi:hypothetical protein
VTSIGTRRFWELFEALPDPVQRLAVKNYDLGGIIRITLRFAFVAFRAAPIDSRFELATTIAPSVN